MAAYKVVPELRSKVTKTRYRLADVCVVLKRPLGKVLEEPPSIAIEILSPEDTVTRLVEKLEEYEVSGTRNIWVFDPRLRKMFVFRNCALQEITAEFITSTDGAIPLTREEIFRD
jgi:Uma2 family endonuclease